MSNSAIKQSAPSTDPLTVVIALALAAALGLTLASLLAWGVLEVVGNLDVSFREAVAVGLLIWLSSLFSIVRRGDA